MKTTSVLTIAAIAALALVGCNSAQKSDASAGAMKPVNTKCPIVPQDSVSGEVYTMYKGQKVVFCCAGCIEDWDTLSDAQKEAKLAKAK